MKCGRSTDWLEHKFGSSQASSKHDCGDGRHQLHQPGLVGDCEQDLEAFALARHVASLGNYAVDYPTVRFSGTRGQLAVLLEKAFGTRIISFDVSRKFYIQAIVMMSS